MSTVKSNKIISLNGADASLTARVLYLEGNAYKITYFASISATSGTITKPTGSTIQLDQLPPSGLDAVDAVVSTIVNGQPTFDVVQTAGGTLVDVSSFDASGNYTLSGTPSAFPIALIYVFTIPASSYQNVTEANILEGDLIGKANLNSPVFTGTPSLPTGTIVVTQALGDSSTKPASTAFVIANRAYDISSAIFSSKKYGFPTTGVMAASTGWNAAYVLIPFTIGTPHSISAITFRVTTASAATNARVGIYTANAAGYPDALVEDSGNISCATTGDKSYSLLSNLALSGRIFYGAIQTSSAAIGLSFYANPVNLLERQGATIGAVYSVTAAYGALPANFPAAQLPTYVGGSPVLEFTIV
jgi:hypothetical protein